MDTKLVMQNTVRLLNVTDAEKFLNFLKVLDAENEFMHYGVGERETTSHGMRSRLKKQEKQGNCYVVVAENLAGDFVGYFSVNGGNSVSSNHSATVAVGVLKAYQRWGVGSQLFDKARSVAKQVYISRFECTVVGVNEPAMRYYQSQGFRCIGDLSMRFYHDASSLYLTECVFEHCWL